MQYYYYFNNVNVRYNYSIEKYTNMEKQSLFYMFVIFFFSAYNYKKSKVFIKCAK